MPAVWTSAEARGADRRAEAWGVDPAWLMEAAGGAVARTLLVRGAGRILVLAGPGKNGGDGLVAARRLAAAGVRVWIYTGNRAPSPLARAALAFGARLADRPGDVLADVDFVVDAVFGTGLSRPLEDPWPTALALVRESRRPVLAVDVPSGVDADSGAVIGPVVAPAAITVTFQALKPGLLFEPGASLAGVVLVADIGLPAEDGQQLTLIDPVALPWAALERSADAHKYAAGRVLVVGGSAPYAGAPALSGLGVLRSGVGYVELYVPDTIVPALRSLESLPLVVRGGATSPSGALLASDVLKERVAAASAVVLGPGLEPSPEVLHAVRDSGKPVVVDAGAFSAWTAEGRPPWPAAIFTPHSGEMARLLDTESGAVAADRPRAVRRLAALTGGVAVLKGHRTLVGESTGPVAVNVAGGSELATMGTGDVLAGVIAALLARGWSASEAARGGVLWHGMAGEAARAVRGWLGVTATDVTEQLGAAFERLLHGARPADWPQAAP